MNTELALVKSRQAIEYVLNRIRDEAPIREQMGVATETFSKLTEALALLRNEPQAAVCEAYIPGSARLHCDPELPERPKQQTGPFDLWSFVSQDETRYELCRPWLDGEWVSTDGRVLVRAAAALFPDVVSAPPSDAGRAKELVADFTSIGDYWTAPTEEMRDLKAVVCGECANGLSGCNSCGIETACENCDGTGEVVPRGPMKVGHVHLQMFYLEKICRLPGVELHLDPQMPVTEPVRFRFEHGIGVLMQMKTP